jgi:hypothetical protein
MWYVLNREAYSQALNQRVAAALKDRNLEKQVFLDIMI